MREILKKMLILVSCLCLCICLIGCTSGTLDEEKQQKKVDEFFEIQKLIEAGDYESALEHLQQTYETDDYSWNKSAQYGNYYHALKQYDNEAEQFLSCYNNKDDKDDQVEILIMSTTSRLRDIIDLVSEENKEKINKILEETTTIDSPETTEGDSNEPVDKDLQEKENMNKALEIALGLELPRQDNDTFGSLSESLLFVSTPYPIGENIYRTSHKFPLEIMDIISGEVFIDVDIEKEEVVNIEGSMQVRDRFNNDTEKTINISNIDDFQMAINYTIPYVDDSYNMGEFGITGEPDRSLVAMRAAILPNSTDKTSSIVLVELVNFTDKIVMINRKSFDTIDDKGKIYKSYDAPMYETDLNTLILKESETVLVSFKVKGDVTKPLNLRYQYTEGEYTQYAIGPIE